MPVRRRKRVRRACSKRLQLWMASHRNRGLSDGCRVSVGSETDWQDAPWAAGSVRLRGALRVAHSCALSVIKARAPLTGRAEDRAPDGHCGRHRMIRSSRGSRSRWTDQSVGALAGEGMPCCARSRSGATVCATTGSDRVRLEPAAGLRCTQRSCSRLVRPGAATFRG